MIACILFCGQPLFVFRNKYALLFWGTISLVKQNAYFLRNTLPTIVIFYVFQKFYTLRKYVHVMKDCITDFSCTP